MRLQQLRYIVEVFNHALNVSMAAKTLRASQPSMSKQIRQLEDNLGVQIFERHGKHFSKVTPVGKVLVEISRKILAKVDKLESIAFEETHPEQGSLTIAASNNQLRYHLPMILKSFTKQYPRVAIHIQLSPPSKIVESMMKGEVDFAITSEVGSVYDDLLLLPCYQWQLVVVVRDDHPLALKKQVSEEDLANHSLATYPLGFLGLSILGGLFNCAELSSRIVFTATDSELLKSYVRLGLGVGVIEKMALDPELDRDLVSLDASSILPIITTKIGFLRGKFLRAYMIDFITYFSQNLTHPVISAAADLTNNQAVEEMFQSFNLPLK
jgi:LysR family cys regulon transcriptional activator